MNTGWVGSCEEVVAKIGGHVIMVDVEIHEVQFMRCPSF